jgi:hypothetical protein
MSLSLETHHCDAEMWLTEHARSRSQQRAIPPMVIDLLLRFGTARRSGATDYYTLDKAARRRMRRYLGDRCYQKLEDQLDCWAVVGDDGCIVSVGHRAGRHPSRRPTEH